MHRFVQVIEKSRFRVIEPPAAALIKVDKVRLAPLRKHPPFPDHLDRKGGRHLVRHRPPGESYCSLTVLERARDAYAINDPLRACRNKYDFSVQQCSYSGAKMAENRSHPGKTSLRPRDAGVISKDNAGPLGPMHGKLQGNLP
jgi:hypothetical protein